MAVPLGAIHRTIDVDVTGSLLVGPVHPDEEWDVAYGDRYMSHCDQIAKGFVVEQKGRAGTLDARASWGIILEPNEYNTAAEIVRDAHLDFGTMRLTGEIP